jgi:YesN/AraC family two-component response regulator
MSYGLGFIWLLASFFNDQVIFTGVVFFILFIGVFGINQTPVFFTTSPVDVNDQSTHLSPGEFQGEKYQKSGLSEQDVSRLSEELEMFMKVNKPYKNPDLTLDDLANLMKVQPHRLSQVINSSVGKTFYHYINTYRIQEFLILASLPGSNKFTYLGLAYDCGFQSKTTFNKYFRIVTGKTPSEYFQTATAA